MKNRLEIVASYGKCKAARRLVYVSSASSATLNQADLLSCDDQTKPENVTANNKTKMRLLSYYTP
jgi:hypothetical protein